MGIFILPLEAHYTFFMLLSANLEDNNFNNIFVTVMISIINACKDLEVLIMLLVRTIARKFHVIQA